jgi:hypothetical protein
MKSVPAFLSGYSEKDLPKTFEILVFMGLVFLSCPKGNSLPNPGPKAKLIRSRVFTPACFELWFRPAFEAKFKIWPGKEAHGLIVDN